MQYVGIQKVLVFVWMASYVAPAFDSGGQLLLDGDFFQSACEVHGAIKSESKIRSAQAV